MKISLEEINKKVQKIIVNAGDILVSFYQKNLIFKYKTDGSFCTQADIESEKYLMQELSQLIPGAGFYAEESGVKESLNNYVWIIDPLDGTSNFSIGISYFCISIALTYNNEPVLGWIYNPISKELFYAQKGNGAYCNDRLLIIEKKKLIKHTRIAFGISNKDFFIIFKVLPYVTGIRICGASALDLAYVAAGKYDGVFLTQFKWWDVAAGILLISESQGSSVTFEGFSVDLSSKSLISTNLFLINPFLELIGNDNSI